jgi:hypothetical protein
VCVVLAVALLAGCGASGNSSASDTIGPPVSIDATSPSSSDGATIEPTIEDAAPSEEAAIVAAMAAYHVDNNGELGDAVVVDRVNVIDQFATLVPDGYLVVGDDGRSMDSTVRQAVERSLAPATVTWFHTPDDILGDPAATGVWPTYQEIGLILTFGAPEIDGPSATIVSEMWCGMVCGGGTTFTLEHSDTDDWIVTGTTGNGWAA